MKKIVSLAVASALTLTAGGAFAQSHHGAGHGASTPVSEAAYMKAIRETDAAMMKNMDVPFTGNPDVDFVQRMVPHHQGAIEMAKVIQQYGKDAEVQAWAKDIISAQEKEIAEMRAWLKKNGG